MSNDRLLCLDIETVPDRTLMPLEYNDFPKPIWHRVVAISFVEARIERTEQVDLSDT
jgi:hypothetical protein